MYYLRLQVRLLVREKDARTVTLSVHSMQT